MFWRTVSSVGNQLSTPSPTNNKAISESNISDLCANYALLYFYNLDFCTATLF